MTINERKERMSWEDIQKKYPDQWVGLTEVQWVDDDGVTVQSAVVSFIGTKSEVTLEAIKNAMIARYTTPDNVPFIGAV